MSSNASQQRGRAQLQHELRGDEYRELLTHLQKHVESLQQFHTPEEVVGFLCASSAQDPARDDILRFALGRHQRGGDHRWQTILLAVFWPALESIHYRKREWDPNPDQRWQNTLWSFLQTVAAVDVERHGDQIFEKLYAETARRLYRDYERQWRHEGREVPTEPGQLIAVAGAVETPDTPPLSFRQLQARLIHRYRAHRDAGRIGQEDCRLLVATRVYGQSIADYCRETRLGYACARKRRSRAEAAIEDSEDG